MSVPVPHFVRRAWRLLEAKRALLEGEAERALGHLRDPTLALSPRADDLRLRAMDVLCRSAAHRASQGRDASVARILDVVACEDPKRADEWRRRLHDDEPPPARGAAADEGALQRLLAEMRAQPPAPPAPAPRTVDRQPPAPAGAAAAVARFHLAVDDGGEFLCVSGSAIVLGHAQAGRADIPFLADLESRHARIAWMDSFHTGPSWQIEPLERGSVTISGERLAGPKRLADGDIVELSPNLSFRFRLPEDASSSALLELQRGIESEGAGRILLLVPGSAGRIRIAAHRRRHVPVAGLEHEVELALHGGALKISCAGGVRVPTLGAPGMQAETEKTVPCPPDRRVDIIANARPSQRTPFGLAIGPIEGPVEGSRGGDRP